jgi:hypothetical protein
VGEAAVKMMMQFHLCLCLLCLLQMKGRQAVARLQQQLQLVEDFWV